MIKEKAFIFIITLLLFNALGFSSSKNNFGSISGFIFDDEKNPLQNVNVYISGTIRGSSTNKFGYFKISSIPAGKHELVVSIVGFKTEVKHILLKGNDDLKIDFYLNPTIYETERIIVSAAEQERWYQNLQIFKELFLGKSSFAKQCLIQNEEVLDFSWDRQYYFSAKAKRPLIIINKAFGLKIHCVLISFSWDKLQRKWSWMIKPWFKYLKPKNDEEANLWNENREKAYHGSMHHFLFSLIYNRLEEEGFDTYISKMASNDNLKIKPLHQYEICPDSLVKQDLNLNKYKIYFKKYLKVVYKKVVVSKWENTIFKKKYQTSWIKLNHPIVNIDEFGYPEEILPFVKYGFWAELGVADLLPRYYKFDE